MKLSTCGVGLLYLMIGFSCQNPPSDKVTMGKLVSYSKNRSPASFNPDDSGAETGRKRGELSSSTIKIKRDLFTNFVPSTEINGDEADIVLQVGEELRLKIDVSGDPKPEIEWYFSPFFSDYDMKLGTRVTSLSRKRNELKLKTTLQEHGYYWAKIFNSIENPIYSNRVKVNIVSETAQGCNIFFPEHGYERVSKKYKEKYVEFGNSCEPLYFSSVCVDGEILSQDNSSGFYGCSVEEEICTNETSSGCEIFSQVSLVPAALDGNFDYNNPSFELTCPADYNVKIDRYGDTYFRGPLKDDNYNCTGQPERIEVFHRDGDYTLSVKPFLKTNPSASGVKIMKQSFSLNGNPIYGKDINFNFIKNLSTTEDLSVKKVYIDDVISQNVLEHYPRPFSIVELFWKYFVDAPSQWMINTLNYKYDFSGVGWNTSHAGTLVSNQIIVTATHWEHQNNSEIVFHDKWGGVFKRRTIDVERAGGDTSVQFLNEPLPETVKVYKMLSWKNNLFFGAPVLLTNHKAQVGLAKSSYNFQGSGNLNWNKNTLPEELKPAGLGIISGDSGNPVFIVVKGELVLVAHPRFPTTGPSYSNRVQQQNIQAAIERLMSRH